MTIEPAQLSEMDRRAATTVDRREWSEHTRSADDVIALVSEVRSLTVERDTAIAERDRAHDALDDRVKVIDRLRVDNEAMRLELCSFKAATEKASIKDETIKSLLRRIDWGDEDIERRRLERIKAVKKLNSMTKERDRHDHTPARALKKAAAANRMLDLVRRNAIVMCKRCRCVGCWGGCEGGPNSGQVLEDREIVLFKRRPCIHVEAHDEMRGYHETMAKDRDHALAMLEIVDRDRDALKAKAAGYLCCKIVIGMNDELAAENLSYRTKVRRFETAIKQLRTDCTPIWRAAPTRCKTAAYDLEMVVEEIDDILAASSVACDTVKNGSGEPNADLENPCKT